MSEYGSADEPEAMEGRYANYVEVGHNAFEFVLGFGQFGPDRDGPRLHTRVITTPTYARAFSRTLQESLVRYEETFGPIPSAEDPIPE